MIRNRRLSWISTVFIIVLGFALAGCTPHSKISHAENGAAEGASNALGATAPPSSFTKIVLNPRPLGKTLLPRASTLPWLAGDISVQLKDPNWISDPLNYEITKTRLVNIKLSVPILEYHEVNYFPGDAATLKPGQFQKEMAWLHQNHFHPINLGQLYGAMYYGYKLPSKPVVITFDDGYESNYLKAFPLLKKYRFQATIFMISGDVLQSPNRTVRFPKLTASELREMQESGLVDIESHTVHHTILSSVSLSRASAELTNSAAQLQEIVRHPIVYFCYPFGGYTKQDLTEVRKAGYLLAVTEHQGYANAAQGALTLHRIAVLEDTTMQQFKAKLAPSLH